MELTITRIGAAQMYGRSISRYEVIAPDSATREEVEAEVRRQFPTRTTPVGTDSVQWFAGYSDGKFGFEYHSEH